MKIVSCPEQNFSTVCRPEYSYDYMPDGGLQIQLGEGEDAGFVTIFKTDAPGGDFAAETYFNNAYLNLLKSSYGENLVDPGEYTLYPFGNREMPGRMVMYMKDGKPQMRFCLYDLEEEYFVRYEAFCAFEADIMQSVIDDLSDLVRYFQPDAAYYSESASPSEEPETAYDSGSTDPAGVSEPETEAGIKIIYPETREEAEAGPNFKTIICTAEGFSTRCGFYDEVEYKASNGVTAFLSSRDGSTIWVRVQRLGYAADFDAGTYFRDEVIPEMEYIYDDCNYYADEFTSFTADGKEMPGQEFHFTIRGFDYTRRVLIYQTGDELVRFEAQYTEDSNKMVMNDLEKMVSFYQPDPDFYSENNPQG